MYFVHAGEVEVLEEENFPPIAIFKEGDIFGEVSESACQTHAYVNIELSFCNIMYTALCSMRHAIRIYKNYFKKIARIEFKSVPA